MERSDNWFPENAKVAIVCKNTKYFIDFTNLIKDSSLRYVHRVSSIRDTRGREFDMYLELFDSREIEHYEELMCDLKTRIK